jgi:hypothetical protein
MILTGRHSRLSGIAIFTVLLLAAGCGKIVPNGTDPSQAPLFFSAPETKALTNTSIGPTYDTRESFKAYAAYSEGAFDPSGSFTSFWDGGVSCSYNDIYRGWAPAETYYWPATGYLSFRAYSPADAPAPSSFSWATGFVWNNFSIPAAGQQYDLMYSNLVTNCRRSDYARDGDSYDDDPDFEFIYKGVNLSFRHALSLVEVQASSALGSYSSIKYCIQKVVLHNAYNTGNFSTNSESWAVNIGTNTSYTLLDLSGEVDPADRWKVLPGSDEYPVSVHPNVTMILLPQELNRESVPDFSESVDAYLTIVYKCTADNTEQTTTLPLTGAWERGKKYTYKLVFSSDIEFTASISAWDTDVTHGSYLIVQ